MLSISAEFLGSICCGFSKLANLSAVRRHKFSEYAKKLPAADELFSEIAKKASELAEKVSELADTAAN
jgi:hypothetical protein